MTDDEESGRELHSRLLNEARADILQALSWQDTIGDVSSDTPALNSGTADNAFTPPSRPPLDLVSDLASDLAADLTADERAAYVLWLLLPLSA